MFEKWHGSQPLRIAVVLTPIIVAWRGGGKWTDRQPCGLSSVDFHQDIR
jgi:hypothetical protein